MKCWNFGRLFFINLRIKQIESINLENPEHQFSPLYTAQWLRTEKSRSEKREPQMIDLFDGGTLMCHPSSSGRQRFSIINEHGTRHGRGTNRSAFFPSITITWKINSSPNHSAMLFFCLLFLQTTAACLWWGGGWQPTDGLTSCLLHYPERTNTAHESRPRRV